VNDLPKIEEKFEMASRMSGIILMQPIKNVKNSRITATLTTHLLNHAFSSKIRT